MDEWHKDENKHTELALSQSLQCFSGAQQHCFAVSSSARKLMIYFLLKKWVIVLESTDCCDWMYVYFYDCRLRLLIFLSLSFFLFLFLSFQSTLDCENHHHLSIVRFVHFVRSFGWWWIDAITGMSELRRRFPSAAGKLQKKGEKRSFSLFYRVRSYFFVVVIINTHSVRMCVCGMRIAVAIIDIGSQFQVESSAGAATRSIAFPSFARLILIHSSTALPGLIVIRYSLSWTFSPISVHEIVPSTVNFSK